MRWISTYGQTVGKPFLGIINVRFGGWGKTGKWGVEMSCDPGKSGKVSLLKTSEKRGKEKKTRAVASVVERVDSTGSSKRGARRTREPPQRFSRVPKTRRCSTRVSGGKGPLRVAPPAFTRRLQRGSFSRVFFLFRPNPHITLILLFFFSFYDLWATPETRGATRARRSPSHRVTRADVASRFFFYIFSSQVRARGARESFDARDSRQDTTG